MHRSARAVAARITPRRHRFGDLISAFLAAFFELASPVLAAPTCEAEILAAAKRYDVPVAILYAVALTETGKRGELQPFALNIDGRSMVPASLAPALAAIGAAQANGAKFIDIGCMQINHRFHGDKFVSLAAMFDPYRNVDYAARFLKQLRVQEGSWTLAVARYNAGPNNNPAQKKYVCAVIASMARSGFGGWTPQSRSFCEAGRNQFTSR